MSDSDGCMVTWFLFLGLTALAVTASLSCATPAATGPADIPRPNAELLDNAYSRGKIDGICEAICKIKTGVIGSKVTLTPEGKLRCECGGQVGD